MHHRFGKCCSRMKSICFIIGGNKRHRIIKYDCFCFYMLQRTRKRTQDKLVSAETVDGGKLHEAATRKEDQTILVHIQDKDCIALEVKYHKSAIRTTRLFCLMPRKKNRRPMTMLMANLHTSSRSMNCVNLSSMKS